MRNRYRRMLFIRAFEALYRHYNFKSINKKNLMPFNDRYNLALRMVKKYHKSMNLNIKAFGLKNLDPSIKGCIFMGNHQGKDDGAVTIHAIGDLLPTAFVIADHRSHQFLFGPMCDMLGVKRIKFDDLKSQLYVYKEMTEEILNGKRFIVFPEAGYNGNKNNLQHFNTPCFMPILKSKCPIIPFCLYDTWKIYDKKHQGFKKLDSEVHFLKPIYYDEYASLSKVELAELVKSRIEEKLNMIKLEKNEL